MGTFMCYYFGNQLSTYYIILILLPNIVNMTFLTHSMNTTENYESLCLQKTRSYAHESKKNSVYVTKSAAFCPQLVIRSNDYKRLVTFVTVGLKFS
jgi:hypothetical protein